MFAALYIPDFHLTAQLRHRPELEGQAVVLLDAAAQTGKTRKQRGKARIFQRTQAAAEQNVELGMTAVQAQARCAGLHLLNRNAEDETHAQSELLDCAAAFTPDFEATAGGVATLDLFGAAKSPQKLGQSMVEWLAGVNLPARVGLAENPDLALLAAKFAGSDGVQGTKRAKKPKKTDPAPSVLLVPSVPSSFLAPLPISAIEPPPETREILESWGIHTLGDFTRLPRNEVTERLGPETGVLWDHAAGKRRRLLELVRPPAGYAQSAELDFEITTLEPLLFLLRRMLEKIVARLTAAYLVAERILLTLRFDDGISHERSFRVPDPCAELELLFGMLQTHLEDFSAKSPVVALSLDARTTRPGKHQFQLFESSFRDPNRFADTLARLEALLGSENVGTPELLPTHRSDAFQMRNAECQMRNEPPQAGFCVSHGLPLRRFRPPQPVAVQLDQAKRPHGIAGPTIRGAIVRSHGPWLSSGDWWDRFFWARQDWDVQLENGGLFRLFREHEEWRLDGVYG